MSEPKPKTDTIHIRVSPETKNQFHDKCIRLGGTSEVLRELVIGFIEGRVTITPPPDKESLYNVPRPGA